MAFLNGLHYELNPNSDPKYSKKSMDSKIADLFNIELKTLINCQCGYSYQKEENSFFMPIPLFSDHKCLFDLRNCFQKLFEKEKMEMKCPGCQKHSLYKQTKIVKFPRNLIFHLQRFQFTGITFKKLDEKVDFPLNLFKLSEFSHISTTPLDYELHAICHHSGSRNGGHYWAYVKYSNKWFKLNDSATQQVSDESEIQERTAYILFYRAK